MVKEQTREFTVSRRKFVPMHGSSGELVPAKSAPIVAKQAAQELANSGQAPLEKDVLTVRLFPKGKEDWTVDLTVDFETEESREDSFPHEAPPEFPKGGHGDVRFLFVHGPADVDVSGLELPGVDHVVDLSEDSDTGHAPFVEVATLGKKAQRLPVGAGDHFLSARFFDRTGLVPLAGRSFTVNGRSAQTDDSGVALLERLPAGDLLLEFEEGQIVVPSVHDQTLRFLKPLPFVELGPEELAQGYRQLLESEGDDAGDLDDPELPAHLLPGGDPLEDEEDQEEDEPDEEPEGHHDEDRDEDEPYMLCARFVDKTARAVVANTACTVDGIRAETDADGVLRVLDLGPGYHEVAFADGTVTISATHHPELLILVRLPFHTAEEGAERLDFDDDDDEPDDDDELLVPEWVAVDEDADLDDEDLDEDDLDDEDVHGPDPEDLEDLAELADLLE